MICVKFFCGKDGLLKGFEISGHSFFSQHGKDIVCAGVSSAVQMCCNGLTDIVKADVNVLVGNNKITLNVKHSSEVVQFFLKALKLQICVMQKEYDKNICLKVLEV